IIAGVKVTATGDDGSVFSTSSNATGLYQFPALRAGVYLLRFDIQGFAPVERTLTLLVGQVPTVDVTLQLARTSSTVIVEATAAAVDASTSSVAGYVSPAEVQKIPLNGRNYLRSEEHTSELQSRGHLVCRLL